MRPRLSPPLLFACVAATLAGPVHADPQQARDLIVGAFEKTAADLKSSGTLSWGEPQVSAASGGDLVVLPDLRFTADDGTLEVGRVEFTVSGPGGAKARQRIAMKLPPKMTLTGSNQPPVDISFASGRFAATWAPEFETLLDVDLSYKDVAIADRGGNGVVRFGEFLIKSDGKEEGELWSGTVRAALLKTTARGKGGTLDIAEIAETVQAEKIPLARIAALNRQIRAVLADRAPQEVAGEDWLPIIDAAQALPGADRANLEFALSGFSFSDTTQGIAGKLGKGGFGVGLARAGQDKADVSLAFSLDGLEVPIPGTGPEVKDLIPTRGLVDAKLLGLPAAQLWAALLDAAREGVQSGPDEFKDTLSMQVMEIAHATDATLQVGLALGAPGLSADGGSDFRLDSESAFGVVGKARVTLKGLDPVLEKIRKGPQNEQTQQAMAALSMVKGFGKTEVASNAVVYVYDFTVDKAGAMMLNGQDLQQLMAQQQDQQGQGPGQRRQAPRQRQ